jgi:hypothetical protein
MWSYENYLDKKTVEEAVGQQLTNPLVITLPFPWSA